MSQTSAVPRTIITQLQLENFKSYAGVQVIGPFHKCFSSVVGPNGSGKSNVIDALLFVFGWRASKIRQSKVSELIHNSAAHPNLTQAKVLVKFVDIIDKGEGDDDYEIVEGSEVVVGRAAYQNNTSKYFIDDRSVQFKDIQQVLRGRGIDLDHNRFLILQGEVESIAMLKPKAPSEHEDGLLEYLEDIIGSNRHVEAIGVLDKEVEGLNEQFAERLNRVKAVEKDRAALDGPRREAEEYLAREMELLSLKCLLEQLDLKHAKQRVADCGEKYEAKKVQVDDERTRMTQIRNELQTLQNEYESEKAEYEAIVREMEHCKSEYQVFERKDIKCREDLKHTKKNLKAATDAMKKEQAKFDEMQSSVQELATQLPELEDAIASKSKSLTKEEDALEKMLESLKDEINQLRSVLGEKQTALEPWTATLAEQERSFEMARAELEIVTKQQTLARDAVERAKETIQESQENLKHKTGSRKQLEAQLSQETKSRAESVRKLQTLTGKETELNNLVRSQRDKVEAIKFQLQQSNSRGRLHAQLMQATANKQLNGVCGRLGDLGIIDAQYDIAVTCATNLNNYVVETTQDAEACVAFLRKNNLGVATFVVLDKVEGMRRKAGAPFESIPNVPRLFDLIEPINPRYTGALYNAVRDTLVAPDIETARKVAFGKSRRRVVTMQGQVLEISGSMSGGGGRPMRGGMKLRGESGSREAASEGGPAVSEDSMRNESKLMEQRSLELKNIRDEITTLQESLRRTDEKIQEIEFSIKKCDAAIAAEEETLQEAKASLPILEETAKGASNANASQVEKLRKDTAKWEKEIEKTRKGHDKAQAEIEQVQQEINSVGGPKVVKTRAKITALKQELEHDKTNLAKAQVQMQTHNRNIGKAEKSISDKQELISKHSANLEQLETELQQLTEEAFDAMQAYQTSQTVAENKATELKANKTSFEKMERENAKLRTREVDLENELKEVHAKLRDAEIRAGSARKRIQVLRNKAAKSQSMLDRTKSSADSNNDETKTQEMDTSEDVIQAQTRSTTEDPDESAMEDDANATQIEKLGEEIASMRDRTEEELADVDREDVENQVTLLQQAIENIKPNFSAVERWQAKDREYLKRSRELEDLGRIRDEKRREHDALKSRRLQEFMDGFTTITMKLKEIYQMITLGGDAELEIVDSLDPFSEGIVFSVRPPKKSWKNISNLSGGEKTLSSLALVFALHHFKPTPLYVMDEIDAALDFKNVSIVAHFVKERTKNAQFIIISLRNHMFELADRLVGIYKTENQTKSVTINPASFVMSDSAAEAVEDSESLEIKSRPKQALAQ
eukprot:c16284_g2_i1.p1 GENE.c16284_g2_i1~~c16284_g2_i1.p1  ORF type:complete len:1310 (+),score=433.28 c16284_g2_i1:87-4016(+)